jgi:hypothetical protein
MANECAPTVIGRPLCPATHLLALTVLLACTGGKTNQSTGTINQPFMLAGVRVDPDSLNAYLAAHEGFTSRGGEMRCAYRQLGQRGGQVFVWAVCTELLAVDDHLVDGSGMSVPAAFDIALDNGRPRIVGVELPGNGDRYAPSIRRIFPASTWPAIFANGRPNQPASGLGSYLRSAAAARFGLPPAAASAPRRYDLPAGSRERTVRGKPNSSSSLDSAARRVMDFLRGKLPFDQIALSDTVTFYLAPEGGGARATYRREQLRRPSAWVIPSEGYNYRLAPPAGLTNLTTKVGRHLVCGEHVLADEFPQLAHLPHVGTMLGPDDFTSCLQAWSMTFVFDTSVRPRLVAVAYDQWEW